MPAVFDAYVMVDWSAASVPTTGANSIWIACLRTARRRASATQLITRRTRREAMALLADLLSDLIARDRVVLVGFDFAFGYPAGFAAAAPADRRADWRGVWQEIAAASGMAKTTATTASRSPPTLNRRSRAGLVPVLGLPGRPHAGTCSPATKPPAHGADGLAEFRLTDRGGTAPQSVWKLVYPGSVGGQTLLGIAHLERLRHHPWLEGAVRVWPFETGLTPLERPAPATVAHSVRRSLSLDVAGDPRERRRSRTARRSGASPTTSPASTGRAACRPVRRS